VVVVVVVMVVRRRPVAWESVRRRVEVEKRGEEGEWFDKLPCNAKVNYK
jgi:hypothetical protein